MDSSGEGFIVGVLAGLMIWFFISCEDKDFKPMDKAFIEAKEICLKNDSTVKSYDLFGDFTCENGIEFNLGGVGE